MIYNQIIRHGARTSSHPFQYSTSSRWYDHEWLKADYTPDSSINTVRKHQLTSPSSRTVNILFFSSVSWDNFVSALSFSDCLCYSNMADTEYNVSKWLWTIYTRTYNACFSIFWPDAYHVPMAANTPDLYSNMCMLMLYDISLCLSYGVEHLPESHLLCISHTECAIFSALCLNEYQRHAPPPPPTTVYSTDWLFWSARFYWQWIFVV